MFQIGKKIFSLTNKKKFVILMKILVINDIADYFSEIKQHFSLTKGYYFAKGLSKIQYNKVYFLTTGNTLVEDNLTFINNNEINNTFLRDLNLILFIREHNIIDIFKKFPEIKNWVINDNRKKHQKFAIKSDSLGWVYNSNYMKNFEIEFNIKWDEFIIKYFDILFVQTNEYKNYSLKIITHRLGNKFYNLIKDKIYISRMGVPNKIPIDNKIKNPYDINHSYCLDNYYKLKPNMALHSLPFTLKNRNYCTCSLNEYNKSKIILIYMGRIKVDNGRILYMMRDIMLKLGNDYELHIFPGRFVLPDINVKVWSTKYMDNLQTLRDYIFGKCTNVIIHVPFDEKTKTNWVQYADIGIDFCSVRPQNRKSYAGHAKVLEYCYYGLKVVCEKNICNSYLVENGNNGILLDGIASVDDYVEAIKGLSKIEIDNKEVSQLTIDDSNWDKITEEFHQYLLGN